MYLQAQKSVSFSPKYSLGTQHINTKLNPP